MLRHYLGGLLLALALITSAARAQTDQLDWLDEMPTVSTVTRAVFEELKVEAARSNLPGMLRDDDHFAARLVGTLILLRQVMFLEYNEEPPMDQPREAKLKAVYAAYSEAELVIGQGAIGRRGYITRGPDGRGCHRADAECYRRWFANDSTNYPISAEYRRRILTRLFPCGDRAKDFIDLRQRHAVNAPHMPSPANTGQVEPEVLGIAPRGCATFGGDANNNGLCDEWENIPDRDQPPIAAGASPTRSGGIRMTTLRYAYTTGPARGLKVDITSDTASTGLTACFRALRADRHSLGAGKPFWQGVATIQAEPVKPDGKPGELYAIVAPTIDFQPDAKQPYVLVEITSGPSYGAVHCEHPSQTWEKRHLPPTLGGLHGPYLDVETVMRQDRAGLIGLALTGNTNVEWGWLVVRNTRIAAGTPRYFVTPPTRSTQFSSAGTPRVLPEDYFASFKTAFQGSCEDPAVFKVAALVHTHPTTAGSPQVSNFSMADFNQALGFVPSGWRQFGEGNYLDTDLELTVMIDWFDRCIRVFDPRPGGDKFDFIDEWLVPSEYSELWNKYTGKGGRVRQIGCAPR